LHELEHYGFVAFRTAGSHGVADIIAINPVTHQVILVQCKARTMSKAEYEKMRMSIGALLDLFGKSFTITPAVISDNAKLDVDADMFYYSKFLID
jgi:Holliday junction resolvase